MSKIFFLFSFVFLVHSVNSQTFPDIDGSINYDKFDFSAIDELIKEGQPNKAISKLLVIQIQSFGTENLSNIQQVYYRLRNIVPRAGKENEDIQKLFKEQHKLFLTTKGVVRNLSGKVMAEWITDYRIRRSFSFDDESLYWPLRNRGSELIRLKNNDISPLEELYENAILKNEDGLMRISSALLYDSNTVKYRPTLFDVFAQQLIEKERYANRDSECHWESTEGFYNMELNDFNRIQANLEKLNKRYKRWDAYALCVSNRLSICDKDKKGDEYLQVLRRFQKELDSHPASNRFVYRRAAIYAENASNMNWIYDNSNKDGFIKSLKIIEAALTKHPKSDFTIQLNDLKKKILKTSLSFSINNTDVPNDNNLMKVNYRNLTSAYFAIYHVIKDKTNGDNTYSNPLQRYDMKLIKERTMEFEEDPNMMTHSKDFIISELDKPGVFLVVSAPNKELLENAFNDEELQEESNLFINVFQLSNIIAREKSEESGIGVLVNDAKTGKPLRNALIKVEPRNKYKTGGFSSKGRTDKNGYYLVTGMNRSIYTIFNGDDSLSSIAYFYSNSTRVKPSFVCYTDRSIYRPGQEIYYKTLSFLEKDKEAKFWLNRKVEIEFKDNNNQVLYSNSTNCNEFGSTAGSFVLPKSGFPLGNVDIYIENRFAKTIRVEEYKRPTFEVTFDKPEGRVVLGAPFVMKGKAVAYAGYPLGNTEVVIDVSENRYFPYWCFVEDGWKNYDTTIRVKTDKDGVFEFEYSSNKPEEAYGVYYSFDAKVVDLSGEVQTGSHSLYLGKTSYSIVANVKNKYRTDEKPMASFSVLNSQGEKQDNALVNYIIRRKDTKEWYTSQEVESEFKDFSRKRFEKSFPKTQYYSDQEDTYSEITSGSIKCDEKFSLQNLIPGHYFLESNLVDEVGDTIVNTRDFIVWNPNKKRNQHIEDFWTEVSTTRPEIDETVNLYVGSSYRKSPLLIAKYNEDGLISMEYIKLKRRKKIEIQIGEENKSGVSIYSSIVRNGEALYTNKFLVPIDSSKMLKLKLKSIQEPLRPGTKQSWEIELSQNESNIQNAELLASMYDASLDIFVSHSWRRKLLSSPSVQSNWSERYTYSLIDNTQRWDFPYFSSSEYLTLMPGSPSYSWGNNGEMKKYEDSDSAPIISEIAVLRGEIKSSLSADLVLEGGTLGIAGTYEVDTDRQKKIVQEKPKTIRQNFNETAFFEPQIHVSADGKYKWNFTLPDALTKWKLMTFAHTPDFKTVYHQQTFEARKELMLETFEPRFWRKGDSLVWLGKVVNLSDKEQTIYVSLKIQNLLDEADVSNQFGDFTKQTIVLQSKESRAVEWPIVVCDSCPTLIRFEAEATTDEFADVVRKNMPILEGKERITLAQNFTLSEKGTHDLSIDDLKNVSNDADILNYSVTVQTQPLWSTMLSLTKVLEPKNELNESYINQYFGARLAKKILDENPKMKQALTAWQIGSDDALTSLLEQNEELKALVLSETPWVLDAQNETEQLRRLGQLLNDDYLNKVMLDSYDKLEELQLSDGSWSWVGADKPSWYITQYISKSLADIYALNLLLENKMIDDALTALDKEYDRRYAKLTAKERSKGYGLNAMEVEWLYVRAVLGSKETEASKYYSSLLSSKWQKFSYSSQSTIGLIALKNDNRKLAERIMASFQDKATSKADLGKYWNRNTNGYGWYQNKIETQAKMIQFYQQYGEMNESVARMQKWLLQQKRTQLWGTEKSTVMACYVLRDFGNSMEDQIATLSFGTEDPIAISNSNPFDKHSPQSQTTETIKEGVKLTTSSDALVFASAQMVYTDMAENISKTTGDFRVERNYYILENGEEIAISDERQFQVGDIIKVKLKLVSNRDLDFVYLEDPKAAGWEPVNALSGYRYENGYYYQSNRDSKTEFFIENVRKGTYLYEYDLKITLKGSLQVGPAKATCYYAPSFTANTKGERFTIGKQ